MKNYILFIFLICFLLPVYCFCVDSAGDNINVFLAEYKDGQKTGNYIHFHLFLYKDLNGLIRWSGNQEFFVTDDSWKATIVSVNDIQLEADPAPPINWTKGESLKCKFQAIDGEMLNLVANKVEKENLVYWKVTVDGKFRLSKAMPFQKMHYEDVQEITLKYPILKTEPIYYEHE